MNFDLTPEQRKLKLDTCEFAQKHLNSNLLSEERACEFSREKWRAAAGFGIHGLPVPEEYGGSGQDVLTTTCAMEGLGYGCRDNGLVFAVSVQVWSVEIPLLRFGTTEQRRKYLPSLVNGSHVGALAITEESSGSDAYNIRTIARRHSRGYVLGGKKQFVTNAPIADVVIVFAILEPGAGFEGMSAFLVERGMPGFSTSSGFDKMGLRTAGLGEVFLEDCEVPKEQRLGPEGAGGAIFQAAMDYERFGIQAANIGMLQRQREACVARARDWKRFGQPIGKFQSIANRIVDMEVRLEAARLLLYKAAYLKTTGQRVTMESAMAKLYVTECAVQSSLDAIQIFGAQGYMTDTGIERDLRDAVAGTIYSGTSEVQRVVIARYLGIG